MKYLKLFALAFAIAYLIAGSDRFTRLRESRHQEAAPTSTLTWGVSQSIVDPEMIVWPTDQLIESLQIRVSAATNRVYLSVYMLTDRRIVDLLLAAHERGLDVRVILEPSVYLFPKVNTKSYTLLRAAGVTITYSSERDFNFNHSKYWIIDNQAYIGTGNMTKSSLNENREFFVWVSEPRIVEYLVHLFESDFEHIPPKIPPPSLIISPINARLSIEALLLGSKKSIRIMSESLSDEQMVRTLVWARSRWVTVSVCLPEDRPISEILKATFRRHGIETLVSKKPHVHAKTLLIDNATLMFGSINFTTNSIEKNREVSIVASGTAVISNYNKIFKTDCKG